VSKRCVSLIYAYYDNPKMLQTQLEEWKHYDPESLEDISFIIVDDASPGTPALRVARECGVYGLNLRIFRVGVDRAWGQDAARNIAMRHCETDWALMTDMDHLLLGSQVVPLLDLVEHRASRGRYYMPARVRASGMPYHPHPNSFLFHRVDFWDMGGYDEDFVGFYGSDGNFRKCARGTGLIETPTTDFFLRLYGRRDVEDANTMAFTRKEGDLWAAKNKQLNAKRMGPPYKAINPFRVPYEQVYG
jgi:hypothetical protein